VTTTPGADTEDLDIGTELNATDAFGNTVDDADVEGLFDGEITISIGGSSESYDVHEEVRLGDGAVGTIKAQTGLTAQSADEDHGSNVFLEALSGSVEYRLVFDENLQTANFINQSTNDDPITLNFMGRELVITSATATSITVDTGERFILNAGESATTSDGRTVTLEKAISTSKAQITIDGQTDILDENSVRQIAGTEVKVTDVADDDGIEFDSAVVIVGTDATFGQASDTFTDDEEFLVPCGTLWKSEDCDDDDPDWVWNLAGLNQGTASSIVLGVRLKTNIDTPEDLPPAVGDEDNHILDLPGGFAWISLDRLSTDSYQEYEMRDAVEDIYEGSGATIVSSAHILEISGGGSDDSFIISVNGTNQDTDALYLYVNDTGGTNNDTLSVFWEDPDDGNKLKFVTQIGTNGAANEGNIFTADLAQIDFEGATVQMNVTMFRGVNDATRTNFTVALEPDVNSAVPAKYTAFYVEESTTAAQINYVGHSDSDTTTGGDITYGLAGTQGSGTDISGWEEDTRTAEGIIILNPDSNSPGDTYKFSVPSEIGANDFQVFVTIGSSGTSTTTTTSSGGIKQLVPITGSVTKLDTEVNADSVDTNLVLVGGPAVNRLTAQVMGKTYPSYGAASGIPENSAWISIIDEPDGFAAGKVAVVVAGWEAENTRVATSLLQQAATELAGVSADTVTVTGTSVATAVITPSTSTSTSEEAMEEETA
jgi:hypothetical protein